MAAKKLPSQEQPKAQPKQTFVALKPLKKAEDAPPAPVREVASEPVVDAPIVPKSSKKKSRVSATHVNKTLEPVALNAIAPSVEPEAIAPTAQDIANAQKSKPSHQPIFQAIGILVGQIKFTENRGIVVVEGKEYPLLFADHRRKFYEELRSQLKSDSGEQWRLIVYPKITHFPKREKPYHVGFQLVGLDKGCATNGVSQQLQDFEFKLCGLWQFIPTCQIPCVSVYKNFSSERLTYIKQIEKDKKVSYLKPSHIPLMWGADTKPFRFNTELTASEQGHPAFVEVIAKFVPERDVFEFSKLLAEPTEKAPNFLKAGKEDKAEALQLKKQRENNSKASIEST